MGIPKLGGGTTRRILCKEHFFEEYKKAFISHPSKMVIVHPALEKKFAVYGYYDLTELKKFSYTDEDIEFTKNILGKIPQARDCAYFGIDVAKEAGVIPSKIVGEPSYISKEEAWNKIYSTLSTAQVDFGDGFTAPYGGEGIFITYQL